MRGPFLVLGVVFAASNGTIWPALAQIQGRGMTATTPPPNLTVTPVETAQQKRQKSSACTTEAKQSKLSGKDRTAYLKYCNSTPYEADFKAPGVAEWKNSRPQP